MTDAIYRRNPALMARDSGVVAAFLDGEAPGHIAAATGLSRPRISQILAAAGLSGRVAGRAGESREVRVQLLYGISPSELKTYPPATRQSYIAHRMKAASRGIGWELTLPSWLAVWEASGLFSQRGIGASRYCMARNGDTGPYAKWNVTIKTNSENTLESMALIHDPAAGFDGAMGAWIASATSGLV